MNPRVKRQLAFDFSFAILNSDVSPAFSSFATGLQESTYLIFIHSLSAFVMSKRDAIAAHLPRLEGMADAMNVDARHTYAGEMEHVSHSAPATAFEHTTHHGSISGTPTPMASSTHHDPRDLPYMMGNQSALHPRESRSQTVHTIKFQRIGHGDAPSELKVEETDVEGFVRYKSLEHNFFGILNHGDYHATPCQNSTYPANYWRKFFEVDTEGATFPDYS